MSHLPPGVCDSIVGCLYASILQTRWIPSRQTKWEVFEICWTAAPWTSCITPALCTETRWGWDYTTLTHPEVQPRSVSSQLHYCTLTPCCFNPTCLNSDWLLNIRWIIKPTKHQTWPNLFDHDTFINGGAICWCVFVVVCLCVCRLPEVWLWSWIVSTRSSAHGIQTLRSTGRCPLCRTRWAVSSPSTSWQAGTRFAFIIKKRRTRRRQRSAGRVTRSAIFRSSWDSHTSGTAWVTSIYTMYEDFSNTSSPLTLYKQRLYLQEKNLLLNCFWWRKKHI